MVMESSLVFGFLAGFISKSYKINIRKLTWILSLLIHLAILITLQFAELSILMILLHFFMVEENWNFFGGLSNLNKKNKPSNLGK